jgi:ATP-dependent Lon protease
MAQSAPTPSAAETPVLPAMTVPNVVVFPGLVAPLLADRPMAIAAVESAASQNLHLVLFRSPEPDDFDAAAQLGVAARILRLVRLPAGHVQILLQGAARVRRLSMVEREPMPRAQVEQITAPTVPASGNPLREAVLNSLKVVASLSPTIPRRSRCSRPTRRTPASWRTSSRRHST